MKRGALWGALAGLFIVALIGGEYVHAIHGGATPGGAALGAGWLTGFFNIPFGYVFLFAIAYPAFKLLDCCTTGFTPWVTILTGVFLNCVALGILGGQLRKWLR